MGERAQRRRAPSLLTSPPSTTRQALTADPSNPTLLAARAQAHLKLGNWLEAAGDAGRAAELEPGLVKAWARKG